MPSLSGNLLVAVPELSDPNFARTVVLLIHHDDEGAFGLVLNRVGTRGLGPILRQLLEDDQPVEMPLMIGGPVEGPLMALHSAPGLGEREVAPQVYLATSRETLAEALTDAVRPLRLFMGYSGWGPGQLEDELASGSWNVTAATADFVFADEAVLWRRVATHIADAQLAETIGVRHVPPKPWHN